MVMPQVWMDMDILWWFLSQYPLVSPSSSAFSAVGPCSPLEPCMSLSPAWGFWFGDSPVLKVTVPFSKQDFLKILQKQVTEEGCTRDARATRRKRDRRGGTSESPKRPRESFTVPQSDRFSLGGS